MTCLQSVSQQTTSAHMRWSHLQLAFKLDTVVAMTYPGTRVERIVCTQRPPITYRSTGVKAVPIAAVSVMSTLLPASK